MTQLRLLLKIAVATCCLAMLPGKAMANPIGGTAALNFLGGGTLSGYFVFDPTLYTTANPTAAITSWDLTTTDYGVNHRYLTTNTADGASRFMLSNSNNDEVLSFFQNFSNGSTSDLFELDVVFNCFGTANCVNAASANTAFDVVGGLVTCPPGTLHCISSDEQTPLALQPTHYLASGVLNVSDPPGTLAFNAATTIAPGYTEYKGGGGGGGTPVPEPSSLFLLGTALFGLAGIGRRK